MLLMSDALYNGIIGAGGGLFCYLIYLLFKYLWSTIKSKRYRKSTLTNKVMEDYKHNENKVKSKENEKEHKTLSDNSINNSAVNNDNNDLEESKNEIAKVSFMSEESNNEDSQKYEIRYNKRPLISDNALRKLKGILKYPLLYISAILVAGLLTIIIIAIGAASSDYLNDYLENSIIFWPLLLSLLTPLILYNTKKYTAKRSIKLLKTLIAISIILIIVFMCASHIGHKMAHEESIEAQNQREKEMEEYLKKIEEVKESEHIQRTFWGCSFGEENVSDKLVNQGYKVKSYDTNEYIEIFNVKFGGYKMDTVRFSSYKDKFYLVEFVKDFEEDYDESRSTYKSIDSDIEEKYYYEIIENYVIKGDEDNSHVSTWEDRHTKIELSYTSIFDSPHRVVLSYYDKDSNYNEELREDF